MRAKTFSDAVFTAAYTVGAAGSAAEAARALDTAGLSGSMALATAPSGGGGVAFGSVAVAELAESAVILEYHLFQREWPIVLRVYLERMSGEKGQWCMKAEDIKDLSPEQIADKFTLQEIPDKIVEVRLSATTGTR